jgi:CDP-diacylglycerol--glycerol-3-phosphate 3-phosphatidyltransferase
MKLKKLKLGFNVQKAIDGIIDKSILRFIPYTVRPNQVTVIRFILIPIVYWLLIKGWFGLALFTFFIAASTDFVDGAMARTRNQITDIGKIIDPVADKLLIMTVLLYIGFDYFIVKVFVIVIILELTGILLSIIFSKANGRPIGANLYGKIKMILQSFSVGLFILGILINDLFLVVLSEDLLFLALLFALFSAIENLRVRIWHPKKGDIKISF